MININTGFHLGAALPLDDRAYLSKAEMLAVNENLYTDYFLAVCSDDGYLYMFDKSMADKDKSAETGKFKLFAGDVDEAIKILNSDVDTKGSVLYTVFNNAAAGLYESKKETAYEADMTTFSIDNIIVSKADYDKCKGGDPVEIASGYTMSYDASADEFSVDDGSSPQVITLTEKTLDVVTTIKKAIQNTATEAKVTVETYTSSTAIKPTEGYLKTYEIFQNKKSVAKIDIPKDLVVTSGIVLEVEEITDPSTGDKSYQIKGKTDTYTADNVIDDTSIYYGYPVAAGTFIKLVIANQKAPVIIDAHDLVDTGSLGKVTEDIVANVEVGGVLIGDKITKDTDITALVKQLLVKYFAPEIKLTASEALLNRVGTTLTNVTLTAAVTKKSETVTGVIIDGDAVTADVSTGGNFTKDIASISTDTEYVATATDGKKTSTAKIKFSFVLPYMYGVSSKNVIDSDSDLTALTEVVTTEGAQTFSYTAANQYGIFVMPASYGAITSILDPSSFENISSWTSKSYTTASGEAYTYYVTNTPINCTNFKYTFK